MFLLQFSLSVSNPWFTRVLTFQTLCHNFSNDSPLLSLISLTHNLSLWWHTLCFPNFFVVNHLVDCWLLIDGGVGSHEVDSVRQVFERNDGKNKFPFPHFDDRFAKQTKSTQNTTNPTAPDVSTSVWASSVSAIFFSEYRFTGELYCLCTRDGMLALLKGFAGELYPVPIGWEFCETFVSVVNCIEFDQMPVLSVPYLLWFC